MRQVPEPKGEYEEKNKYEETLSNKKFKKGNVRKILSHKNNMKKRNIRKILNQKENLNKNI